MVTKEVLEHIAALSRLELSESEKAEYIKQLDIILKYVDKLNELDTHDVEAVSHVLPINNIMREDIVKPSMDIGNVLVNAPDNENGYFRVPKIIE